MPIRTYILYTFIIIGYIFQFFIVDAYAGEKDIEFGIAIKNGDIKRISELIAEGVNPLGTLKIDDDDSYSLIFLAILYDNQNIFKEMVSAVNDKLEKSDWENFQNFACSMLRPNTIRWLSSEPMFDANSCLIQSVIHEPIGIVSTHKLMIESLLEKSPTKEIEKIASWFFSKEHRYKLNRRYPAEDSSHPLYEIVDMLVKNGANPDIIIGEDDFDYKLGTFENFGEMSILNYALHLGEIKVFELLLEYSSTIYNKAEMSQDAFVGVAKFGSHKSLAKFINEGIDLNLPNKNGELPLLAALSMKREDNAIFLLENGAIPNNDNLNNIIKYVVSLNEIKFLHYLIESNLDIPLDNVDSNGKWPLKLAVEEGNVELVKGLLKLGANPNFRNSQKKSVLHEIDIDRSNIFRPYKISPEHFKIATLLFSAGFRDSSSLADSILLSYKYNNFKIIPFVQHLIDLGVNIPIDLLKLIPNENRWLEWGLNLAIEFHQRNELNEKIFEILLENKNFSFIQKLLKDGIKVPENLITQGNHILKAITSGNQEIVEELIKYGYTVECKEIHFEYLVAAMNLEDSRMIDVLIGLGVDPNINNSLGTILHFIASNEEYLKEEFKQKNVAYLIQLGLDPSLKNSKNQTAEEIAKKDPKKYSYFLKILAYSGKPSVRTKLHQAVIDNNISLVRKLLSQNITDIDTKDSFGRSALTLSLWLGNFDISNLLMNNGAKICYQSPNLVGLADIDYAHLPDLSHSFRIQLLKQQILILPKDISSESARADIENFNNQLSIVPEITWTVNYKSKNGFFPWSTSILRSNTSNTLLTSNFYKSGTKFGYTIRGTDNPNVEPYYCTEAWPGVYKAHCDTFIVIINASLTIPKCENPFENPKSLCFPKTKIFDPIGTESKLTIKSKEYTGVLNEQEMVLDRSNGPIFVYLNKSNDSIPFVGLDFIQNLGPETQIKRVLENSFFPYVKGHYDVFERMIIYSKLYQWYQLEKYYLKDPDKSKLLKAKSIHTARKILSLQFISERYQDVIGLLLREKVAQLINIQSTTVGLRKLIVSSIDMEPEKIKVLIALLKEILAKEELSDDLFSTLERIASSLEETEISVTEMQEHLNAIESKYLRSSNKVILDYQGLLLEAAQVMPDSELINLINLSNDEIKIIGDKIIPEDVIIKDSALNGRGASIKRISGITKNEQ